MEKLRVAVLGAGKIGKYHVREFSQLGADVVAVLGSSYESSNRVASELEKEFGVKLNPYSNLETLLEKEILDAVSICTPPGMHETQTKRCLESDLHVMCEKPFVETRGNDYEVAGRLIDLANKRGKVLTVNTQWLSIVDVLLENVEAEEPKKLSLYMEPGHRGEYLLRDHLPHANSILIGMSPVGRIRNLEFPIKTKDEIKVKFNWSTPSQDCDVEYHFKFKADRPREVVFSVDDHTFKREIGEKYQQFLVSNGKKIPIEDPLRVSIRNFVADCEGNGLSLATSIDILQNLDISGQIISEY